MRFSHRTLANLGLLLGILLVGALGVVTYRSVTRLEEDAFWVAHTQEVQTFLRGVLADLENAESAQRGFVITGQADYRADFRRASGRVEEELRALDRLTRDNPDQQRRMRVLESLARRRIVLLREVIGTYETQGFEAVRGRIRAGVGAGVMDSIRAVVGTMEREEQDLLESRSAAARASGVASERTLLGGSILAGLLLLAAGGVINRDITLGRRKEEELRGARAAAEAAREEAEAAREAAEAANRTKTQFLATVSHEIRTPLNAIIGMTELVRDTPLSSEQAEFTRTVYSNAEALLFLINDLLDSSKIEAGQVDIEEIPFDVRDVVDGVAEILSVRADAKGLEFVADVQPDLPDRLLGDPNRLRQILMNLVGNAIKFTDEGEISIHAEAAGGGTGTPSELHLRVRDTGPGIAPEDQARIFERFVQADASTVRRYSGTGLGLNISRALVGLMGGRMELDSAPGRGSTFHVFVPFRTPVFTGAAPAPRPELGSVRVLVVEDNATARAAMQRALTSAGALAQGVASGAEALERLRSGGGQEQAVVFMDERLPDGHGADFARTFHQERLRARVVLVAAVQSQSASLVGRSGIVDCVYKPVRQRRLLEALDRALGTAPAAAPPRGSARPVVQRSAAPAAPNPARILLVEDNRDNWTLATRILAGAGYAVDLAENGQVAVERATRFRYDLILMDVEMPVMDGLQATAAIRAEERSRGKDRVPIVALTAHAVEGFRERALESGMDDYTTKPIKREQLLAVVERWADTRPVLLVVDDSPENQTVVRNYLKEKGYRLDSAYNGGDGVRAFERQRVSIILLDMDMPVMDGYETARTIRRMDEGRSVPILAMTGYEGVEEKQKCLNAGCSFYISKPIRRAALLQVVDSLLGPTPHVPAPPPPEDRPEREDSDDPSEARRVLLQHREELLALRQLIGRRSFEQVRSTAAAILRTASERGVAEIGTLAEELGDAARREEERSSLAWAGRLGDKLREAERLAALESTGLLDSPPEESFDRFTRMAARIIGAPVALISLVDEDRQFFKSQAGLPEPWATRRETPLSHSFCRHVVSAGEPLIVDSARENVLVHYNPAISEMGVEAYAGMPITTPDGQVLGSFCAVDTAPRHWTPEELSILRDFAEAVSSEIALRQALGRHEPVGGPTGPGAPATGPQGEAPPADEASGPPRDGAIVVVVDEDIADLVPQFLESRRRDASRIRELLAAGDFREIQRLGHNMKGAGEGYGFREISTRGREIEAAAKVHEPERIAVENDRLERYLQAVTVRTGAS